MPPNESVEKPCWRKRSILGCNLPLVACEGFVVPGEKELMRLIVVS